MSESRDALLFTRLFRPTEYRTDIYNPESFEQQQDRSSAIPITSMLSPNVYLGQTIDHRGAGYFQSTRRDTTFIPSDNRTTAADYYLFARLRGDSRGSDRDLPAASVDSVNRHSLITDNGIKPRRILERDT